MTELNIQNIDPLEIEPMFIDVSWNTNDERIKPAIDDLFRRATFETRKIRRDARENLKRHLRAVLIVCVRAYQLKPDVPIACPFSNSFGKDSYMGDFDPMNPKRYDFNKIKEVVRGLEGLGFIHIDTGRRDFFGNGYQGKATRFKSTALLNEYIQAHQLHEITFKKMLVNEGMIITYKNNNGFKRILYDYSEIDVPEDVVQSREWLPRYNQLIQQSDICLKMQVSNQVIDVKNNVSYRVFHQKRYDYGGRFYGAWWTYCSREDRRYIAINNEQSVECDYRSNHLYLFYGLHGREMPDTLKADPYTISNVYHRNLVKLFITRLFNCRGEYGIINHIATVLRERKADDHEDINLLKEHGVTTAGEMRRVLDVIYDAHPLLREATDANQGNILMNWDSKIAAYILKTMTDLGIPTLCIHDSFIVPRSAVEPLKQAMNEAYDVLNIPLARPPIEEKYSRLVINQEGIAEIYLPTT